MLGIFLLKKLKSEEYRNFLCLDFVLGGIDTDAKISTFFFECGKSLHYGTGIPLQELCEGKKLLSDRR